MQNGDPPHSFSQPGLRPLPAPVARSPRPGLVLPTQLVQNQIHELAKTLPPPRKQNTACDACRFVPHPRLEPASCPPRSRKVKCNRIPGQEKVRPRATPLPRRSPSFISTVPGPSNRMSPHPLLIPAQHCLSKNYPCTLVPVRAPL